ncbi:hypothetical protein BIV57_11310 [Mangrovactinospora gilvigrisea]|uniref:AAA+ ATPase domain-containing protein n=1 Tax=Mangrovactinospora gilvigrisea TaxID=1428644 RepID=A0A1J7BFQ0_9ACTN|nr:ATP-binding protein [Mangrovactinospora gilvigrisea]OIV37397.1 hypothetical protein BIV57_11310 [Mangrovactinospora gilvigrisea]
MAVLRPRGDLAGRLRSILTSRGLDPDRPTCPTRGADVDAVIALEAAAARIPALFAEAVTDHPQVLAWVRETVQAARSRADASRGPIVGPGPSLLLAGPTGTGKTHSAYAAIRAVLGAGVRCEFVATTDPDLQAALRPAPGRDPEAVMRRMCRCSLLLLDDLGVGKSSDWTEAVIHRLVNARYERMLPTIYTTNLPTPQLQEAVGERVTSRLAQITERIVLDGPDRRLPTA